MNELIRDFLDKVHKNKKNIHCIGDAMLDEYYEVKVKRISPEAPVPVMLCQNEMVSKPGGVANVAYQFKFTNTNVNLITLYDVDAVNIFYKEGLAPFYFSKEAKLPVKRRFVENGLQVGPRLDIEFDLCNLTKEEIQEHFNLCKQQIKKMSTPDAVILSDYNKGFFKSEKNYISLYPNSITIVDPKSESLDKWKNCTVFKPNAKEAFELSGYTDWRDQCDYFRKRLNCKAVVITNAGEGVCGTDEFDFFQYKYCSNSKDVQSVIGAGDCFAAFLALGLCHGFSVENSCKIAFHAGLVYVKQKMNRPIVLGELSQNKIIKPEDLTHRDFDLAFTNGCFDILHKGHLETLKFAKSKAKKLVVAVNSDQSIKRLKGSNRPVVPLEHRMEVLANLEFVDFVTSFDEDTPLNLIEKIKPDCLIKGGDYLADTVIGAKSVKQVFIAPLIDNFSSSNFVKNKIF